MSSVRQGVRSEKGLKSLVFRLSQAKLDAVRELSEKTRVAQSVYLREAIADLLAKHEATEWPPEEWRGP